jgi:hypothetical protein
MKQWFYVKNDLVEREDVNDIIQHLIRSRFDIRRPLIVISDRLKLAWWPSTLCATTLALDIWSKNI